MAYREPFFCSRHMYRGGSGITAASAAAAGFPASRVADGRHAVNFKHGTSQANNTIAVDAGGVPILNSDRLLIPTGHNLAGLRLLVETDDNSGFATPTTILDLNPVATSGVISAAISGPERHIRCNVVDVSIPEYPEIWITRDLTPTRGPAPDFKGDGLVAAQPNIEVIETQGGETFRTVHGPSRKVFDVEWRFLTDVDMDPAAGTFGALAVDTNSGALPFWFFDTNSAHEPIYVELVRPLADSVQQDHPDPRGAGNRWRVSLQLIEVLA